MSIFSTILVFVLNQKEKKINMKEVKTTICSTRINDLHNKKSQKYLSIIQIRDQTLK